MSTLQPFFLPFFFRMSDGISYSEETIILSFVGRKIAIAVSGGRLITLKNEKYVYCRAKGVTHLEGRGYFWGHESGKKILYKLLRRFFPV